MTKIFLEFLDGCLNGRTLEGGIGAYQSTGSLDPVLNYWIDSHFGRVGHHFYVRANGTLPKDDLYEVVGALGHEDELGILAEYRTEPRV